MIVLTILKVIGIVLLVILLLILLLLGIVLFVPVRYRSTGYKKEANDDYYIDLNASWFLKALRFKAVLDPDGLRMNLRFLWLTLMDSSESDENEAEEPDTSAVENTDSSIEKDTDTDDLNNIASTGDLISTHEENRIDLQENTIEKINDHSDSEEVKSETTEKSEITITEISDTAPEPNREKDLSEDNISDITDDSTDTDQNDKDSLVESDSSSPNESSGSSFSEKMEKKFRNILGKIDDVSTKIAEIKTALSDKENIKALKLLIKDTKYLLRHYRFRSLNGHFTYGSEDPSSVGSVMMYLSLLYPVYGESFIIEPVFDRSVIAGDMKFKGRIRVIHLLIVLIELMLNKKIRQFVINRL
ncbi:hypothetical protein BXO88_04875 [Oribacterium sp. C9]|uniref:hypothetical protein n=1 Tax=Oribacterium sp. C9 TaxID=1943579 RepID=UPI00098EEFA6|nr:hypothetical protein [Oribacterium sp. C9]OON87208.1 hypothetical protein BXO88_04875 [Oribacterium sp. C9]